MADGLTRPHDYRLLLESCPSLIIVGGQAVNIWAVTYLNADSDSSDHLGSIDMDVLASLKVEDIIKALPDWKPETPPMWSFDIRRLRLTSRAEDGRLLVVEVLGKVPGLEKEDLEAVEQVTKDGATYRALDPIAMLRAKARNVRLLDQEGPPPRQDRSHLRIIAKCVCPFLREAHEQSVVNGNLHPVFIKTLSRAFRTLSDRKISRTLFNEGIHPMALIPACLLDSPIERVRTTYAHQMPRLAQMESAAKSWPVD